MSTPLSVVLVTTPSNLTNDITDTMVAPSDDTHTVGLLPNEALQWRHELDSARAKIGWLEANASRHHNQLRDVVARICLEASWSKMTVTKYGDHTPAELIDALTRWEEKARKARRARTRKLHRSQERLRAEKECFAALSRACDEVSERAGSAPSTTCGHRDSAAVSLTA